MKLSHIFLLVSILDLAGCATVHREQAPGLVLNNAAPVGFRPDIRYISTDPKAIKSRFSENLLRRRAASNDVALNILALSGGGAGGSFGAGALVGLSRQEKRPRFDVVTGVSAGALMAPFAFLGSSWDAQLTDNFSGAHSNNFLVTRGMDMLFSPGIYQNEPLIAFVDHFVTPDMIKEVASQAALGRLLLVATTDLDKEETVIWDMGQIAAQGGEVAHNLFRDVLVASASIPGVFPPIIIPVRDSNTRYDEMHIDASATVPFFFAPALAYILPLDPNGLKGTNIYVIVNGQLAAIPKTTGLDTISILSRSLTAVLQHRARTEIAMTSEFAQKYDMNLKITAIPVSYPFRGPLDFSKSTLLELFNYGADCARDGKLWTTVEQAVIPDDKDLPNRFSTHQFPEGQPILSCPLDNPVSSSNVSTTPR
jgi:hypothetical protein